MPAKGGSMTERFKSRPLKRIADPTSVFVELLLSESSNQADQLADDLIRESIYRRHSIRSRGAILIAGPPLVNQALLTSVLNRVKDAADAKVIEAVGEWGGEHTAALIGLKLRLEPTWREPRIRMRATRALASIGGPRAVDALVAQVLTPLDENQKQIDRRNQTHTRPRERDDALDALEELAGIDSSEVAEGGMMPTSRTALELWRLNRFKLLGNSLCAAVFALEELEPYYMGLGPRLHAVCHSMLTAIEPLLQLKESGG